MTVVFVELAGIFPVSDVQAAAADVVGLPVESTVVVVNWHIQVTFRFVLPLTVAVSVRDWDTMTVCEGAVTDTVTTLVLLLPPQPANANRKNALRPSSSPEQNLRDFITTRTPQIHSNHLMIRNGFNFKMFDRPTAPAPANS